MKQFAIPDKSTGKEIKLLRKRLKLTQAEMACLCGVSKKTVERWESEKKPITGAVVSLIQILWGNPELVSRLEITKREKPIRMYYMDGDHICTVIDVDEAMHEVEIKNYVSDPQKRAFGRMEYPTFDDYLAFLESRCFPKSRDKMKVMLDALDLPFYDPFMIIEKTQGRLSDDEQWIRIER
jgi:putative transcriptional regulator